jgi:hypothetical protein
LKGGGDLRLAAAQRAAMAAAAVTAAALATSAAVVALTVCWLALCRLAAWRRRRTRVAPGDPWPPKDPPKGTGTRFDARTYVKKGGHAEPSADVEMNH